MPGTGLRVGPFAALALVSIAAFVWWGGALWRAPADASHVARFAASYLLVIPLAALLLLEARAWSVAHLAATVGAVWAIKMVVTSVLFLASARGTARHYEPTTTPSVAPGDARAREEADDDLLESDEHHDVGARLSIEGGVASTAVVAVDEGEVVEVTNRDGALHTAQLRRDGRTLVNVPVPPRATTRLGPFPHGDTEVVCANHPDERFLVRASHPREVP